MIIRFFSEKAFKEECKLRNINTIYFEIVKETKPSEQGLLETSWNVKITASDGLALLIYSFEFLRELEGFIHDEKKKKEIHVVVRQKERDIQDQFEGFELRRGVIESV